MFDALLAGGLVLLCLYVVLERLRHRI